MKSLRFLLISVTFLLLSGTGYNVYAQTIDTIDVHSPSMNKAIKNIIILPESYTKTPNQKYPVVYLLHGYGGHYYTWANQTKPDLAKIASDLELIIVCPEGANSWYWDSPLDSTSRYETYVSRELINHIDTTYRTQASRDGRAITGFSMGGHGGLWLGIHHPNLYGACGSMSGGVDIRPFPKKWDMAKQLGDYKDNSERWDKYTVTNQLPYDLQYGVLAIIIDCGYNDFFYEVNQELHQKLLNLNIPHDYIVRPGGHTHEYWNNAVDYQLLFFSKFFRKNI